VRVINIVDNVSHVNMGIWNAAIATAEYLQSKNIFSELWYPEQEEVFNRASYMNAVALANTSEAHLLYMIDTRGLNIVTDIIATHGCWQFATRWGYGLQKKGFKWVYTPQGMLEPWAMAQKKWKKKLYFNLAEKRMAAKADIVRAVSSPEKKRLEQIFRHSKIVLQPNGVNIPSIDGETVEHTSTDYLFLSRLHEKKGILPLVKAWVSSGLNNKEGVNLIIAGPDQGELKKIEPYFSKSTNIKYKGAVYGEEKEKLFRQSSFYLLPSFSEGFPTSVLEAMSYGLVPFITEGCNLPEAINEKLAIKISTDEESIKEELNASVLLTKVAIAGNAAAVQAYVQHNYSLSLVADMQATLFNKLLPN
jgi:glycosyltransferase involved in cell wall biosynthesis